VVPGTLLRTVLGARETVPSYHHQGVAEPGRLTVSARAQDDTVEAVERPDARWWLGVLWHPEVGHDLRLFTALVAAASATRPAAAPPTAVPAIAPTPAPATAAPATAAATADRVGGDWAG